MTAMIADLNLPAALELGLEMLLKGTVILAVAGIATTLLRGVSAANKHAIWTIALGSLLLLPLLSLSMPSWGMPGIQIVPAAETPAMGKADSGALNSVSEVLIPRAAHGTAIGGTVANSATLESPEAVVAAPINWRLTGSRLATAALVIWVIGVGAFLLRILLGAMQVHQVSRRASFYRPGGSRERKIPIISRFGIPSTVRVVSSTEVSMPVCWGLFNPVVILPSTADRWPSDRKNAVLLHELAHATRCDYLAHIVAEVVCSVYWPNPLVWIAARRASMERELACDDEALSVGIRSDIYAKHLLDVVRSQKFGSAPRGAIAMARQSTFAGRIRGILAAGSSRKPVSRRGLMVAASAAFVLALPLAALELRPEESESVNTSTVSSAPTSSEIRQEGRSVRDRIRQLSDGDARVRRYAAWALGELEDERGVRPLVESLGDPDADVRLVSAWALGEIKDERSIDALIEALDDEDALVREMAVLALGEIEHSAAINPLLDAYERDNSLAEPVIWALGEIDTRRAHAARSAVIENLGRRGWENTEVWAGEWLGWNAPRRLGNYSTLLADLNDRDPDVRQSAAWELGHLDDERAVEQLLDALRDEDPAVRAMAIWALDETNPSRRRRVAD